MATTRKKSVPPDLAFERSVHVIPVKDEHRDRTEKSGLRLFSDSPDSCNLQWRHVTAKQTLVAGGSLTLSEATLVRDWLSAYIAARS